MAGQWCLVWLKFCFGYNPENEGRNEREVLWGEACEMGGVASVKCLVRECLLGKGLAVRLVLMSFALIQYALTCYY